MSTSDAMIYATMVVLGLMTLAGAVWVVFKLKTDRQYRRDFWEAYEQDRRTREIQNEV